WSPANGGSVDYLNSCDTNNYFSVPNNVYGYQAANEGDAYCAFCTFMKYPQNPGAAFNYREYPQVRLPDTLSHDQTYCLTFYVSLADSSAWATNNIGVYFSKDSIFGLNSKVLPYTPQINVTTIISDTSDWTEVSGEFTATGGEKYLIFGNFFADNLTAKDSTGVNPVTFNEQYFALYYIDNISLCLCTDTLPTNNSGLQQQGIKVYPNPATNTLTIEFNAPISNGVVLFYDVLGKLQKETSLDATKRTVVDISDLRQGLYFL
ncbi:unnamed protein product, partial [marine sediment metagenome]